MSYFTDTSKHKSAPLSNFPFDTKFVLHNEKQLHIPKFKLINTEEENPLPHNIISVPVSVHRTIDSNENDMTTLTTKSVEKRKSPYHKLQVLEIQRKTSAIMCPISMK